MRSRLAGILLTALLSACGSSGGGGGGSGIPRATTIASLTADQAGTLCDWQAAKTGGYGHTQSCPDGGTQSTDANRATCVEDLPYPGAACPTLTVGDVEDCANAIGPNICNLSTAPACSKFATCLGL
jgi:hypothetical protein